MPYGDLELGQHWLRYWPVTWQHQAITWTNVHYSSLRYYGIHWREISLEMSFVNMSLKIIDSRQQSHLPGANELTLTVTLSTPYFHHSSVWLPEETVFMSPLSITDYLPCLSVSIHRVLGGHFSLNNKMPFHHIARSRKAKNFWFRVFWSLINLKGISFQLLRLNRRLYDAMLLFQHFARFDIKNFYL